MNAKHIESRFAGLGARVKVREVPVRWDGSTRDYAVDVQRDRVNAKQLARSALQAEPRRCKSGHGCHFDLRFWICDLRAIRQGKAAARIVVGKSCIQSRSQGVICSARRSAKPEVRRANPRESASSGLWCNSSISPCEGDGPGANPGFLTIHRPD